MKISRKANLYLNYLLNEWVPPAIRDMRWFGWLITKILYREKAHVYMNFHERIYDMTDADLQHAYQEIQATGIERPTDLNEECVDRILQNIKGDTVLEVGCGRGFLVDLLSQKYKVTGTDVALKSSLPQDFPGVTFIEAPAERLPFADKSFDTVIITHVLEHIRDLQAVLTEIRRVTRHRLIVVVPRERPHFFTPNLHLHFFPYRYSFQLAFRPQQPYLLEDAGGDWFYYEDRT